MAENLNISPVTFSKDQMDQINQLFVDEQGGAEPVLAQQLTSEVAVDYPELITYEGLRDGTAPLFSQLPQFANLAPEDRSLSNAQIISLFAVDEQGEPIQEGTFAGGVKREILPSVFSLAGAKFGAETGMALQQPIPPVSPWNVAAKVAIPTITTLLGATGFYKAGEATADELFGPEKPVTPGSIAQYEAGKTFAGAIGWLPMPYMISTNVNFGAAQFLDNLAGEAKGPLSIRLIAGAEKLLSKTGTAARKSPIPTAAIETGAGAGAAVGAYIAETVDPGDASTRLMAEIPGGISAAILSDRVTALVPNLKKIVQLPGKVARGEVNLKGFKGRRQQAGANRILDILEESGEDVDAIIERLSSKEFEDVLIDPDTGKPITLTAGMKADSPALLAIEAALAQTSPGLGKERSAKNVQANNALRNTIAALVATGNPDALQLAAQMAEDLFSASLTNRLQRASANVLSARDRVGGTDPQSNVALSTKLFELASTQLSQARAQEKKLWKAVEDVDIKVFRDADGNEVAQPNFLTAWENSMPKTEEAAAEINKKLGPLATFINRKRGELGANVNLLPMTEEFQTKFNTIRDILKETPVDQRDAFIKTEQDALLRTSPDTEEGKFFTNLESLKGVDLDGIDAPLLTTTEATEMRQLALNIARQQTAIGDYNAARIASNFADGLLDDLNFSISEGENAAYDIARSYSRSLNDTFTRAFAGRALEKGKTGAERIAPELLAQRLMTGGSDPTYLRVKQINDLGQFAIDNGFEGAEGIAASIRGTQEMIIRNARAAAFDPQTGEINIKSLQKWMNANSELLDTYPALRADLNNAARANTVLQGRQMQNKSAEAAMRGQITFKNLLPNNTESPTFAVSRALANGQKAPIRSLDNLMNVVNSAPEELRADAASGLKHSILEWAMTKGGATSRSFSPRSMYDNLYSKIPNAKSNISAMDWMLENGVIEEKQANQLKKYLTEMVRLEVMDSQGTLGDIAESAGPVLDFYLRISGSAFGTQLQRMLPGGGSSGSLIAAQAGSKAMRNLFDKVPESMKMDVMSEMMENPELLAAMMRKPRNDKEKVRIAGVVGTILDKLGFISAEPTRVGRRAVPQVLSDDEVEPLEVEEEEQVGPVSSIAPTAMPAPQPPVPAQPVAQPTTTLASAPPPPAPSGPVDRARFAAMFPEDADLVRGIGSLQT